MSAGVIAAGGLQAAQTMMDVTANNISNVNSAGYKKVAASFADVYSPSGSALNPGFGVQVWTVGQNFSQGSVQLTGQALDLSINTDGFFIQKSPSDGQVSYTRDGILQLDNNGYLLTQDGSRLQGYAATNGVISSSASLSDLQIVQTPIPAVATTTATLALNLDANATIPTNTTFAAASTDSYNYVTQTTVYDSLGASYPLDLYYISAGYDSSTGYDVWNVQALLNGNNINSSGSSTTPATISFGSTGALVASTGLSGLSYTPTNGAAAMSLTADLSSATQYAGSYTLSNNAQDGYASGTSTGYNIDGSGNIYVSYDTGTSLNQGQIAIANFISTQGLERTSTMSWLATNESGLPIVDQASSQNAFTPGTVEFSNVDLPSELINLLNAQQWYSANAEVEKTYNQSLQTIININ